MTNQANPAAPYAARLEIEYPESLDRVTTFFRVLWAIPALVVLSLISAGATSTVTTVTDTGEIIAQASNSTGGITAGLFLATALTLVVRRRYPRWWFDFALELSRFTTRVGSYLLLLTDRYPATEDEQAVRLDIDYPDAERDLDRWLPLVKWLLAVPHYLALIALWLGALISVVLAWFSILFTGRYPRGLFDYVVGVARWTVRVDAYAFLLVTDRYPPFSLS